jgi:hypothetical protein
MRIPSAQAGAKPIAPAETGRTASSTRSFTAVLDERAGGPPPASPAAPTSTALGPPPSRAAPAPAGPVRAMLERAVGNEKQIDALLDAAARGKTFKPGELLAMQATVARYSQTVEVVSRVADRLVGAVKQTLGTQV